jgi:hypothetical protein
MQSIPPPGTVLCRHSIVFGMSVQNLIRAEGVLSKSKFLKTPYFVHYD